MKKSIPQIKLRFAKIELKFGIYRVAWGGVARFLHIHITSVTDRISNQMRYHILADFNGQLWLNHTNDVSFTRKEPWPCLFFKNRGVEWRAWGGVAHHMGRSGAPNFSLYFVTFIHIKVSETHFICFCLVFLLKIVKIYKLETGKNIRNKMAIFCRFRPRFPGCRAGALGNGQRVSRIWVMILMLMDCPFALRIRWDLFHIGR